MTGLFSAHPNRWRSEDLIEKHNVLRPGGLLGETEIVVGGQRIEVVHEWWSAGRLLRKRPKFRCPDCGRGAKYLHEKDGQFTCRLCTGYDYSSRHRRLQDLSRAVLPSVDHAER